MNELHDQLDVLVAEAYGWPADLSVEEILFRLVELNRQRVAEERRGQTRWLRPEFQAPNEVAATQEEFQRAGAASPPSDIVAKSKLPWPKDRSQQPFALLRALQASGQPVELEALASQFKGARRERVSEILDTLISFGYARELPNRRFSA